MNGTVTLFCPACLWVDDRLSPAEFLWSFIFHSSPCPGCGRTLLDGLEMAPLLAHNTITGRTWQCSRD
jgi:hypothetical protein